ncbi:MAG: AAA family ATPase [Tissierellia bacterium]|nr:AAA family ATPase [Tissierellia bacterium]
MVNKIIINGRGGSGKDTAADYLVSNYDFTKIAFADKIYDVARDYFGMTYKDRDLLQKVGQKIREIRPTIWIDLTMGKAESINKCVISDLRQANEYSIALENGFLPVRINTDLDIRVDRLWKRDGQYPDLKLLENESENGADKFEYLEIYNSGSLEQLYEQIDWIMERDWTEYIRDLQREFTLGQMY